MIKVTGCLDYTNPIYIVVHNNIIVGTTNKFKEGYKVVIGRKTDEDIIIHEYKFVEDPNNGDWGPVPKPYKKDERFNFDTLFEIQNRTL